ncbi:MAG: hypothetical protein L6Q84_24420 [Polyangiaceae bacterium]|nr:hypothetical protein [Polyangiaceae bacterium]
MQHLKELQVIENELVEADDQPPLAVVRPIIAKRAAALQLIEEREPELERRNDAARAADVARLEARQRWLHPSSDDPKTLVKLHEAHIVTEGAWRYAVDFAEAFAPDLHAARAVIRNNAMPSDLREASRATRAMLSILVQWTHVDGRPVGQSYNAFGREDFDVVQRYVNGLQPSAVIWLAHTERQLLRELPKWNERNPRAKIRPEELQTLFGFRRKLIDARVRGLKVAADRAAAEAAALAGAEAP